LKKIGYCSFEISPAIRSPSSSYPNSISDIVYIA